MTTTGFPAVKQRCSEFGVTFDDWQDGAGRLILAKRADGSYAATVGGVVISIPRQVGKTFLIGAIVFALCLLNPGLTVLWTAHRLKTANETFSKMQAFARRKKVKPHVSKIVLGSGDEEVRFHNGSRILFGARERGFGRGFDGVDIIIFDEGQILTEVAIDDMVPATNTAANPLIIFMGTPPKPTDPSEVFRLRRSEALSGDDEDTAYIEFSADVGCDPEDREQWAKANPSYPGRTPESAMLRLRKMLGPDSFPREGLGIWDAVDEPTWRLVPKGQWNERLDREAPEDGWLTDPLTVSVELSQDGQIATLTAAGAVRDAVGVTAVFRGPAHELVGEATTWRESGRVGRWVLDMTSRAAALRDDLEAAGIEFTEIKTGELREGTGWFIDRCRDGGLWHRVDPWLTDSLAIAVPKRHGNAWLIDRWGDGDPTPAIGAVSACWGHLQGPAEGPSIYETRDPITLG